ncbi:MAG: hypothetical protein ABWZ25_08220 [Chitinophagaceae bacterium]
MIINFRKRTLTLADHHYIHCWLEDNEANQLLLEKWIIERPVDDEAEPANTGGPDIKICRPRRMFYRQSSGSILEALLILVISVIILLVIIEAF